MRRIGSYAAAAAALLTMLAPARGAADALGGRNERWPTELTRRPLTLSAGMIEIWAPVQLNASKDADWKPVTSNPSLNFGITDQWQIGVRHIIGLCFGGASNGCANVYNDVGVQTRVSLGRGGGVDFAVQGGADVSPIHSPRTWSANAGVLLRAGGGAVAVTLAPTVGFGLNDRDTTPSRNSALQWNLATYDVVTNVPTFGDKEQLSVPATLQIQLGPLLALVAGASLEGPLNPPTGSFSDFYRIPVGAGVVFTALKYLDVGATLTFPAFGGKNDTRDVRTLAAFVAFRI